MVDGRHESVLHYYYIYSSKDDEDMSEVFSTSDIDTSDDDL